MLRVVQSIGPYMNRRYELQEQYSYYERGKRIESWHMVCKGTKEFCEEVFNKRKNEHKKSYAISFEDALEMFSH